jgi:muramidase (phage lysozyme)
MAVPSFNIAPGESSDAATQRRRLAMALMMQGADTSPVQHWTQGAARVAQSLIGGLELRREDEKEQKEKADARSMYGPIVQQLFGGGQAAPAPAAAPAAGSRAAIDPSMITSPQSAPVKDVYEAGEQSPLDPVPGAITPDRAKLLAAIYQGESGGRPNVMYGGKTFDSYADHPRQPQPIQSGPNAGKTSTAAGAPQFIAPTWDRAQKALNLPDFTLPNQHAGAAYIAGDDYQKRTGGNLDVALTDAGKDPQKLQAIAKALAPTWTSLPGGIEANSGGAQFVQNMQSQPGAAQPVSEMSAQRAQTPGQPAINPALISGMLNNKYAAPFAQNLINQKISEQFKPKDYDFQKMEDGSIVAVNKKDPRDYRVINPVDPKDVAAKKGAEKLATERAEAQAKREAEAPQAQARAAEAISNLSKTGQEALRLSSHPGLASATGPIQGRLPTLRDDPANFEADVSTLGTKLFINTINQMRELSKTGGAVGSVTEKEMFKLENAQRSLSLTQGDKNMTGNLTKLVGDINESMAAISSAYKQQYGQELPFTPIAVPDIAKGASKAPTLDDLLKKYGPK